jgi:glucose/mannose-6-phosphate isomerase
MLTEAIIRRYDRSSMQKLLIDFSKQVEDAVRIGRDAGIARPAARIKNIVVTGLGGSAIGGDLLRSYLSSELAIPFVVNRHYFLPEFVNEESLVIVSSYSGNTEETLAAHQDAIRRKARVICISSDGTTARMAGKYRQPLVTIPRGYPPRAALGYSFFAPLVILSGMKLIRSKERDILETLELLSNKSGLYTSLERNNPPLRIANMLHGKLPVIYSSADRFDVVNLRWRGQIAENAKTLAFGHVLPEMNHNELVGWKVLTSLMKQIVVVMLYDQEDHPRVKVRMSITEKVIRSYAADVIEVRSEGKSLLARMFSLIYLGDWTSYYLAILNRVDPTPVEVIDMLKSKLGKV